VLGQRMLALGGEPRASSLAPRVSSLEPRASSVQPRASGRQAPVSSLLAGSVEVDLLKARGDGSRRRFWPSSPATSRASGGVVMAGPAPGTWAHPSRRGPGSRRAAEEGSRGGQQRRAAEEGTRGGHQRRAPEEGSRAAQAAGGSREGPVRDPSRSLSRGRKVEGEGGGRSTTICAIISATTPVVGHG
jgi:hypothetical protein